MVRKPGETEKRNKRKFIKPSDLNRGICPNLVKRVKCLGGSFRDCVACPNRVTNRNVI